MPLLLKESLLPASHPFELSSGAGCNMSSVITPPLPSCLNWSYWQGPLWAPPLEASSSMYSLCVSGDPGSFHLPVFISFSSWGLQGIATKNFALKTAGVSCSLM